MKFFIAICLAGVTLLSYNLCSASPRSSFRDGDIIFQKSQSAQSAALREATQSPWTHVGILFSDNGKWYVGEAVQPVKITPLAAFIARGKNKEYRVYRHKALDVPDTKDAVAALKAALLAYQGYNYDIYFEWSDKQIYCSELVYKGYYKALGLEVGTLQKIGDLKLDGPQVKKLIKDRLAKIGRSLNLNEPVITPISEMLDPNLRLIYRSN
jgi:hypothetical protein